MIDPFEPFMGSDKSHTKLLVIADYFLVKQHLNERESQKNSEDIQKLVL